MKKLSQLTDFYYETLYPSLKELEKQRTQLKHRLIVLGIIYTTVFIFLYFVLAPAVSSSWDLLSVLVFIYLTIGAIGYKYLIKDYASEFKIKIIAPLIDAIDKNLSYTPTTHVPEHLFRKSELFTSSIDRLSGNDYVRGKIDDVNIQFSDIHAQQRVRNSKGKDEWKTLFEGLFIVAEFNKNFYGKTVVLPDMAQNRFGNLLGSWLQSNNFTRDTLVKMDNNAFEKEFVVYGSDQIEARYILSHSLMKRLLVFKNKAKKPVYISFIGNHIHIAIDYSKDLFEPSVFHSLLEYKVAMDYVETLHLSLGVVEELKLNQKLWKNHKKNTKLE